jgi:cytochrome c peroxidase
MINRLSTSHKFHMALISGLMITGFAVSRWHLSESLITTMSEDERLRQKAMSYITPIQEIDEADLNEKEKAIYTLGRILFHDTSLSADGTVACNTCHDLSRYGMDNKRLSEGSNSVIGVRNTPTIFHSGYSVAQFWDGRVTTIEDQIRASMTSPLEMGGKAVTQILQDISTNPEYRLYKKGWRDKNEDDIYNEIISALTFFTKIQRINGRTDLFLQGDDTALNVHEKRGLELFIDSGCVPCHSGPAIGGHQLQRFGIFGKYETYTRSTEVDYGKYIHTSDPADRYVFKVPGLRLVSYTDPYFHDGSVSSLAEAVRIMARIQLNKDLEDDDIHAIVAWLKTLGPDQTDLVNYY